MAWRRASSWDPSFAPASGQFGRFNGDTNMSRDANVFLTGKFGTLTLGRAMAPSFLPTILFNPFGDSFAFSPLVLHPNANNRQRITHAGKTGR